MRPGLATPPQRSDYVLTAIVVLWGIAEDLTLPAAAPLWLQLATGAIAASAVLVRRTAPIGAAAVLLAMLYLRGRAGAQTLEAITPIALVPLMFYSIARYTADATRAVVGCVALGVLTLVPIWDALRQPQANEYGHAFLMLLVVASAAAGWIVRRRALEATKLRHERDVIVLSRARVLRDAAIEETLRLAGELNSHVRAAIGEAGAQSEAAAESLEREPDVAREHLSAAAQAARNAIGDLRRLLTVLRNDPEPSGAVSVRTRDTERTSKMVTIGPAVAVAIVSIAEVLFVAAPAPTWSRLLGAIAVSIPLLWQRRFPLAAAVGVAAIVCGRAALDHYGDIGPSAITASAVAAAGAARFASPLHAAAALVIAIAGMAGAVVIEGGVVNDLVMLVVLLVLSAVAATAARRRAAELDISKGDYAVAAEERALLLRNALADVRRQLARDTHDSVGHSLASMNMHAEAAMLLVSSDRAGALGHIEVVRVSAQEAIAELERLLRGFDPLLLDDHPDAAGVAEIETLVRDSGLDDAQLQIECQPLPKSVDATAYSIVKEALINVEKHAPGAAVTIDVNDAAEALRVSVVNSRSSQAPAGLQGGHGLAGMRERVALFDGSLTAGPSPDGGWAVIATLPIRAPVATRSPRAA